MCRAVQLYTFLNYCNDSPLKKEILECGAGVWPGSEPLLMRFHEQGYVTHGVEIAADRLAAARDYCTARQVDLDIRQGDMRQLPFADTSLSFVFSYNAIFHMKKVDIALDMEEILRVLRPGGLCFVNFLSVEDMEYGEGEAVGNGEFVQMEAGERTLHSYYEDNEADIYFREYKLLLKEKRILERWFDDEKYVQGYIDYIAQKQ
ncbi:MAG: class I SAM-dependent methyltransferase [Anaerolineae bacterium]|nr:class I SAM-dependent methyltransferase [Anaerolineae bacterium]